MVTMKNLIKTGKSAIVGTVGVGVLLTTSHSISADTLKPVDEKVQEGQLERVTQGEDKKVELQVPDLNSKEQDNKAGVEKPQTENKEVEDKKVEVDENKEKKPEIKNEEKPVTKEEEKPKTDSLQVVDEEKTEDPQVEEEELYVMYRKIDATKIIEKSNNESIWSKPHMLKGGENLGSVEDYIGKEVQVSEMALANRKAWFKISVDGKELGWVSSSVMSVATDLESINKIVSTDGTDDKYGIFNLPWGMQNAKQVAKVNDYVNQDLKATELTVYNGTIWYKVSQNGNTIGWLDSRSVSERESSTHMNVPIESQLDAKDPSRNLETGCEITAVSMMLQFAGADVDKVLLAKEMPYHDYDPNKGYVGDPWSDGPINTVYPPALLDLVKKYAGSSVNLTGASLDKIKEKLNENHPVVAWVGDMHGFGIHAITLTGHTNDKVFYNDPWTGEKDASMSWDSFDNKWSPKKSRALSY
ncbi:C39 family peptidase [Bacillus cereus]|nr:C39 family peptidase [Bacillus cereus]